MHTDNRFHAIFISTVSYTHLDWKSLGIGRIETARSSMEVMSHILDWRPDICLMDVCIGNDKGYEVINCLNNLGVHSNYVMMSGYDEFSYACEAIRCGALDYLLKPVEKKKLLEVVKKIIVERLHGTLPEAVSYTHLDVYKRQVGGGLYHHSDSQCHCA